MQHSAAASHHRTAARTCHMARRRGGPSKAAGSRQAAPFGPSALSAVAANWARAWEGPMDRRWTDPQPGRFEKLLYHFVSSFVSSAPAAGLVSSLKPEQRTHEPVMNMFNGTATTGAAHSPARRPRNSVHRDGDRPTSMDS